MGNRDDGDDLYHDALVTALMNFDQLRDRQAFKSWLYRIIMNTFKRQISRPWWKRMLPFTQAVAENHTTADPSSTYAARRLLQRAFAVISPDDQAMITLFEMEGWSIGEISRMCGRTEQAVRLRLFRARRKMKKSLAVCPSHKLGDQNDKQISTEEPLCAVERPRAN